MALIFVPPAYTKIFKHFRSKAFRQRHIDYKSKDVVAHRQRVKRRARRDTLYTCRRKPIRDEQGDEPDSSG